MLQSGVLMLYKYIFAKLLMEHLTVEVINNFPLHFVPLQYVKNR
jgi:hypothetical protein